MKDVEGSKAGNEKIIDNAANNIQYINNRG